MIMADVAVLGAGVAGLTAAWRLYQAGHEVTVLEAKHRAGGLSHTARDGTVVTEVDERTGCGQHQTVHLDPGQSVNLGPGRLPHHHHRILRVCSELGVELRPYIMAGDANLYADAATGACHPRRRIENDQRGYIAELAHSWDEGDDLDEAELIRAFGDLTADGRYEGTPRAGEGPPLTWDELVKLGFWRHRFHQPLTHFWQDTLLEPVAGMDAIWRGLLDQVGHRVAYNAVVTRVVTRAGSADVTWRQNDGWTAKRFDWVLSSIPLPVVAERVRLRGFSREFTDAVGAVGFAPAAKVGWQAEQRFWEDEGIFGGIHYTDHVIEQFWLPSAGHLTGQKATLTGAYAAYGDAEVLGSQPRAQRLHTAREGGTLFHPEVSDPEVVGHGMSVAWHKVPFQAGGWAHWVPGDPAQEQAFPVLNRPEGRFAVIGDQVSSWPGWQEGCVATAERAVGWVEGAAVREVPDGVPDSRFLTMGDHPDYPGGR